MEKVLLPLLLLDCDGLASLGMLLYVMMLMGLLIGRLCSSPLIFLCSFSLIVGRCTIDVVVLLGCMICFCSFACVCVDARCSGKYIKNQSACFWVWPVFAFRQLEKGYANH